MKYHNQHLVTYTDMKSCQVELVYCLKQEPHTHTQIKHANVCLNDFAATTRGLPPNPEFSRQNQRASGNHSTFELLLYKHRTMKKTLSIFPYIDTYIHSKAQNCSIFEIHDVSNIFKALRRHDQGVAAKLPVHVQLLSVTQNQPTNNILWLRTSPPKIFLKHYRDMIRELPPSFLSMSISSPRFARCSAFHIRDTRWSPTIFLKHYGDMIRGLPPSFLSMSSSSPRFALRSCSTMSCNTRIHVSMYMCKCKIIIIRFLLPGALRRYMRNSWFCTMITHTQWDKAHTEIHTRTHTNIHTSAHL